MAVVVVTIVFGMSMSMSVCMEGRGLGSMEAQMQASLRPGKLRHFALRSLSKGHLEVVHITTFDRVGRLHSTCILVWLFLHNAGLIQNVGNAHVARVSCQYGRPD